MKVISNDGTVISYDKTGKGPALVLVDGAFCYREYGVTPRLAPLLTSHFTVFTYDRRGRGDSTDTKPYSVEREREDLEAVVAATNDTPFVVGFSSGAALVLQAVGNGLKVKKIALFEPPYVAGADGRTAPPANAGTILYDLISQGKRTAAVKYFLKNVMGMPPAMVFLFKLFGRSFWAKNEGVAHTLPYDVAILGDFSMPNEITSRINVPAMVIGGEKSPKRLKDAVRDVGKSIPAAEICFLKGQSHNVSMKVLAPVLISFK
jgi:pimeloyl-ACP methyl ester carboxylesterase